MALRRILHRKPSSGRFSELGNQDGILVDVAASHPSSPPAGTVGLYGFDNSVRLIRSDGSHVDLATTSGGVGGVKIVEVDFGTTARRSKSFTVSDSSATTDQHVLVSQSAEPATGRSADEAEMEPLVCSGRVVSNGQVELYVSAVNGPLVGAYKLSYTLATAEGSGDTNPSIPWVFENPVNSFGRSLYHGKFWASTGTDDLGQFLWEAWVCPLSGNGDGHYWISEGYGGQHAILCGPHNGNMYTGSTTVSVSSDYSPTQGEWLHSMMGWDGTTLWLYVNGVVVAAAAATNRRAQTDYGRLYIGGSDHANMWGRIAAVRGWETATEATPIGDGTVNRNPYFRAGLTALDSPCTPNRSFAPYLPFHFGNTGSASENPSQFCIDLTVPGIQTIIDLSPGFGGRVHHGNHMDANRSLDGRPVGIWVKDATCPVRLDTAVIPSLPAITPPATPGGAKIFDSFSRANALLIWGNNTLGSTETGSLGPKTWQYRDAGSFGILGGKTVFQGTFYGMAFVLNDSADMDVRVDRTAVDGLHQTGLVLRAASAENMLAVYTYGALSAGQVRLVSTVGISGTTTLGEWTAPTNWTTLRATAVGTTITVYCDGTQLGQVTSSTYQTEVGAGLYSYWPPSTARRWDNFTVL